MSKTFTIGYEREDGDLDVVATVNLANVREEHEELLEHFLKLARETFDDSEPMVVLEREDAPDVIQLERAQA